MPIDARATARASWKEISVDGLNGLGQFAQSVASRVPCKRGVARPQ
jgi:hypothetical protein